MHNTPFGVLMPYMVTCILTCMQINSKSVPWQRSHSGLLILRINFRFSQKKKCPLDISRGNQTYMIWWLQHLRGKNSLLQIQKTRSTGLSKMSQFTNFPKIWTINVLHKREFKELDPKKQIFLLLWKTFQHFPATNRLQTYRSV